MFAALERERAKKAAANEAQQQRAAIAERAEKAAAEKLARDRARAEEVRRMNRSSSGTDLLGRMQQQRDEQDMIAEKRWLKMQVCCGWGKNPWAKALSRKRNRAR